MKVFLSWSGKLSHQLAVAFKDRASLYFPKTEFYISDEIEKGTRWLESLMTELQSTAYGIIFLTKNNIDKPWLYFEAGIISKLGSGKVTPFLFNISSEELLGGPLDQFEYTKFEREDVFRLFKGINKNIEECNRIDLSEKRFDLIWTSFKQLSELQKAESFTNDIHEHKAIHASIVSKLEKNKNAMDNLYFHTLIAEYMKDNNSVLENVKEDQPSINLPFILYPEYLIKLMKIHKVTVNAMAIVDQDELFWAEKTGDEIYLNTTSNSTRIFVFTSETSLKKNISVLQRHKKKYNVYVLSYKDLLGEFPDYAYDFSIMGDSGMRLLAKYDNSNTLKTIEFLTDRDQIVKHEDELNKIMKNAIEMPKNLDGIEEENEFVKKVFSNKKIKSYTKREIEMSAYIEINDYDQFEEQHAYYTDMMDRMIEICMQRRSDKKERIRIIELGAGTGIFTKRLAKIRNSEVMAVEIDWMCYKILETKCKKAFSTINPAIGCVNEDSRTYDPPGKFDFIFSSFADHHIKPNDKEEYFINIKRNLRPGGLFIVGDEFLPSYDKNDAESRKNALRIYHNHIISIAKEKNQSQLVKLEKDALSSGLNGNGDFKLSCEEYESLLTESKFQFEKEKIGPIDQNDVGGIYVYIIHL